MSATMLPERTLGRTGLRCSEIGLGTWAFASTAYGASAEAEAHATVRAALDAGVTLFDTAPLYGPADHDGLAEELLGRALGADRDRVLIATKFGRNPSDGARPTFHAARARASVEASLRRLGSDHIDILFFHSPFGAGEIDDDVWAALDDLRRAGKVRFIGHSISSLPTTAELALRWARERRIDVAQLVYNLVNREAAALLDALASEGVGVVAREVLANGFLAGVYTPETRFPANSINARYTPDELAERVAQVERLRFLVRDDVTTLAQAAYRWALDAPQVAVALSGAKTPAELADALAAAHARPYTPAEHAEADRLHERDFPAA